MKVFANTPIQHDNALYQKDQVLDIDPNLHGHLLERGAVRPAEEAIPVSEGKPVKRKPVKEEEKIVPTQKQIDDAEKAAAAPELDPEAEFAKTEVANSVVAGGDTEKIKDVSGKGDVAPSPSRSRR